MSVITGVFKSRAAAEQGVTQLRSLGIAQESINLLTPESTPQELAAVPKTDAEQPGISKGLGAVVGGMAGFRLEVHQDRAAVALQITANASNGHSGKDRQRHLRRRGQCWSTKEKAIK